jgi:glycosyltransferase involved in cell wall biosynthesis
MSGSPANGHGRRLRVLQTTPMYAPSVGGVQTAVREVAGRLARRPEVDVEVLTADPTGRLPTTDVIDGVSVRRVPALPRDGDQVFAPAAFRAVRRGGWDVVHAQCYQTLFTPTVMAGAARAGIPYVLTFHGGGHSARWRNAIRGSQLRALRPLLARAAALVATADWEVDHYSELLRLPRERFVTLPNGASLPSVPQRPAVLDGTVIVSIGRATRYKGHHHAIAALPEVVRAIPDARLWIAGDGEYEGELRALADRLGVADRVEIRAERDRARYAEQLAGAALGVLLSEFETHPMAVIEAAALGVPMLVADNSGLAELAAKGCARPVGLDAGAREHAAAMVRLIREPTPPVQLELKSWDERTEELVSLYRSVCGRQRALPGLRLGLASSRA